MPSYLTIPVEVDMDVAFVPPPAIAAVPNTGSADAPCEIKGTPLVAEGATLVIVAVPAPMRTL